MGIDLGQAIKINHLRANMTQADLANGIISVSYLSKIENGSADPPNEVIELLGEKLKLNTDYSEDDITDQSIIQWFKHLLRSEQDESILLFNKIKNSLSKAIDKQLLSLIEIHKLNYYVIIQDMTEARNLMTSLQKSSKRFSETEMYYYLKFSGHYFYEKMSYKKSLEYYQEAEKFINIELYHQKEEMNHLYYMIASAASKNRQTHLSILYSIKALDYYQSNYDLEKCADCHILQGISYQRIKDYEKAKKSYHYAISIAEKISNDELLKISYQNIGSLYSDERHSKDAIDYFLKSYELRKEDWIGKKVIPISSLMKEYYLLGDISNSKIWLELGMDLVRGIDPTDSIYVFEFTVYKYLIEGIDNSFESF